MSGRRELITRERPLEGARDALTGAFTVQTSSGGELEIRDELDKLVCRVALLTEPAGGWWLTLSPLRGYEGDAERIRRRLVSAGFVTAEAWGSVAVAMRADERSDVVVARVLLRLLEIEDANLPGTLAAADIEYLHDFRVAIRRTRSVLREMRGVFAPDDLERVRASFKWLQDQTSGTRDLDVYLHEFDQLQALAPALMQADLEPLRELLSARHRRARAAMEAALSSSRARLLHAEWTEILQVLVLEDESERPDAARPIGELSAERIRKVHRRMVQTGRELTPRSRPEQYHELRKQGKELRYLLELFATPLFDGAVVKPMIRALKGLQDVLGLHQDRDVQVGMLREIASTLVSEPGGAGALMAVGVLIERLEHDAEQARGRFAASFAEFASEAQCKLVANAFSR